MNPTRFMALTDRVLPWLGAAAALLLGVGLFAAFFLVPPDYQQGETVRIMYIHVPAAWLGMFAYIVMTSASLGVLVWRHPLADAAQKTAAPLGAAFTFVCLVTGSLWGKPMWGTYWVWDARLTSYLVLFLLYLGIIAIRQTMDDTPRGARVAAIMTLVGLIDIPIIKFSVDWWNTLHQPASVFRAGGSTISGSMLWPLLVMALGASALFLTLHFMALRNEILRRRIARLTAAKRARGRSRRAGGGGMNDDAHWSYILAAYGVTFAVVGAVVWRIVAEHRRLLAELARLQDSGGDEV